MKVSLQKLNDSFQALASLQEERLPAKLKYNLGRKFASAQSELRTLGEAHLELIKKHGGVEVDGRYEVPPASLDAFRPEYESLLTTEVDVWGDAISIDAFGDAEIAASLAALGWLLTDGTEAEKPKASAASGE